MKWYEKKNSHQTIPKISEYHTKHKWKENILVEFYNRTIKNINNPLKIDHHPYGEQSQNFWINDMQNFEKRWNIKKWHTFT